MVKHIIIGAGPVGRETARLLAERGDEVHIVSRGGTGVPGTGVNAVALDARDSMALSRLGRGADTLHMCAMAPYDQWPALFPPIMKGVVATAETVGARLLVVGNVYGYGEHAADPLTPDLPLMPTTIKGRVRTAMWESALAAPVPALEFRASDYLGAGAGSLFTLAVLPQVLAGKPVDVVGDPDVRHPWTFTRDVARCLVAALDYRGEWNRAFHVPSATATMREVAVRFAAQAGAAVPDLRHIPRDVLRGLAMKDSFMREIEEMAYLHSLPSTLDASETTKLLGVAASSLDDMVRDTLDRSEPAA